MLSEAKFFRDERVWRVLANLWTIAFFIFIFINVFTKNSFGSLIMPFSILYTGVLAIYVGTKEFGRWYEVHRGRHPGELYVVGWTVVMFLLLVLPFFLGSNYNMPLDTIAAVYIAVLSLFAFSQKSKGLHMEKRRKK